MKTERQLFKRRKKIETKHESKNVKFAGDFNFFFAVSVLPRRVFDRKLATNK